VQGTLTMHVAVRTDASAAIGSGHVFRCLALSQALIVAGHRVSLVSRDMPSHLTDVLSRASIRLHPLPVVADAIADARATLTILADDPPDWVVVDHYALGSEWEQIIQDRGWPLLAIDDLCRTHQAQA